MDQGKRKLATPLLGAAFILALAAPLQAAVYTEPGDAGQTIGTAATTGGTAGTSLTAIRGSFNAETDADLYSITIATPSTFLATTVNAYTNTGNQDTELTLFTSTGVAIALNDDANGFTTDSALPMGNSLYASLAAGTYYIGIAESGNEAINLNSQQLFVGLSQSGDTTVVRGAAGGVNPTTLAGFNGNNAGNGGGAGQYEIDFTVVPEPSTWAMLGLGVIAAFCAFLRRRSQSAA